MAEDNKVYKWFLILAIIYSSLTLISSVACFVPALLPFALIQGYIGIFWYIFVIIMLIIFLVKKIEKIALGIPILYLMDLVFSITIAIVLGVSSMSQGTDITTAMQNPLAGILSTIFPVIILIYSIKLLLRK